MSAAAEDLERPPEETSPPAPVEAPGDPRAPRAFLRAFGIVFAALLGALAYTSYLLDPTGAFGVRMVPPAEQTSRDDKAALLAAMPSPPEVLVLGSSRVWCLDPRRITERTGKGAFNFGVDTATTDDLLAILRLAAGDKRAPVRQILLGMEPEMFSDKRDRTSRLDFSRALRPHADPDAVTPMWILTGDLLVGQTTIEGDKRAIQRLFAGPGALPRYAFDKAGAADWPRYDDERRRGVFDFERNMSAELYAALGYARRFEAFSARRRASFLAFLDLAAKLRIEVLAYIPPIYPSAWAELEKTPLGARFADLEELLQDLDRHGRLRLLTPHRLAIADVGADPAEFYDHLHMTRKNGRVLLDFLLDRAAAIALPGAGK